MLFGKHIEKFSKSSIFTCFDTKTRIKGKKKSSLKIKHKRHRNNNYTEHQTGSKQLSICNSKFYKIKHTKSHIKRTYTFVNMNVVL